MERNVILTGDCREVMATFEPESIDAIVTDPPAGISFMGKAWDHDKGGRDQWITWMTGVMAECHRVLKPGGHILVWALPRTSHWTGMAIEDAGFEVRDKLIHAFASGFPKSHDVSKAIDRMAGAEREVVGTYRVGGNALTPTSEKGGTYGVGVPNTPPGNLNITAPATPDAAKWEGWGTALKPAYEDWWLARKPLRSTVAQNVLRFGTGALNIDGCRIEGTVPKPGNVNPTNESGANGIYGRDKRTTRQAEWEPKDGGRWPANVILTDSIFDGNAEGVVGGGERSSGWSDGYEGEYTAEVYGTYAHNQIRPGTVYGDSGGCSRFFLIPKASRSDREPALEGLPLQDAGSYDQRPGGNRKISARPDQPNTQRANDHPTVKPLELMRHLVRLVTPPGGTVLDPFAGSGTTLLAAQAEGFEWIGIEMDPHYVEICEARLNGAPRGMGL